MTPDERQATLLAVYRLDLAQNPAAAPPDGLDPALASVARRLAILSATRNQAGAEPDGAFVEALARRLGLSETATAPPSGDGTAALHRPRWPILRGAGGARARDTAS